MNRLEGVDILASRCCRIVLCSLVDAAKSSYIPIRRCLCFIDALCVKSTNT